MFALAYTVLQALQDLNLDSQILNQYFDKHESRTLKVIYTFFPIDIQNGSEKDLNQHENKIEPVFCVCFISISVLFNNQQVIRSY